MTALVALSVRSPARGPYLDPDGIQYLPPVAANAFEAMNRLRVEQGLAELVPYEARRSTARQTYLYDGWIKKLVGFFLAAPPYHSRHEDPANACDFHSEGLDHLSDEDHAWLVKYGPAFGWIWTGRNFTPQEGWHFDHNGTVVAALAATPITLTTKEEDMITLAKVTDGTSASWGVIVGGVKIKFPGNSVGAAQVRGYTKLAAIQQGVTPDKVPVAEFSGEEFTAVFG